MWRGHRKRSQGQRDPRSMGSGCGPLALPSASAGCRHSPPMGDDSRLSLRVATGRGPANGGRPRGGIPNSGPGPAPFTFFGRATGLPLFEGVGVTGGRKIKGFLRSFRAPTLRIRYADTSLWVCRLASWLSALTVLNLNREGGRARSVSPLVGYRERDGRGKRDEREESRFIAQERSYTNGCGGREAIPNDEGALCFLWGRAARGGAKGTGSARQVWRSNSGGWVCPEVGRSRGGGDERERVGVWGGGARQARRADHWIGTAPPGRPSQGGERGGTHTKGPPVLCQEMGVETQRRKAAKSSKSGPCGESRM